VTRCCSATLNASSLWFGSTGENSLGYSDAKSINLVGKESVEGIPAWHVQVHSKHDELLDFWIAVAQPTRLLKEANGGDFVLSRYDNAAPRDPIPAEVTTKSFRNGPPLFNQRFIRTKSLFGSVLG